MWSIVSNLKFATLQLLLLLLCCIGALGADVTLAWDASPDADVVAYRLKYGTASGTYTEIQSLGKVLEGKIPNVEPGTQYYAVVTAVNAAGLESSPSNEVTFNIPRPPSNLRTITQAPQANGMLLNISGEPAKRVTLLRKGGNDKWKKIHTIKDFSGTASYLDKDWKQGKEFEWKLEIDKV
jgi:fibronectin type 3 domain-containing protein